MAPLLSLTLSKIFKTKNLNFYWDSKYPFPEKNLLKISHIFKTRSRKNHPLQPSKMIFGNGTKPFGHPRATYL